MNRLWRDMAYAARTLARTPGFTVVAVTTLAIGIGANVAIFTVVNGVLLEPLPFDDPDQLVAVWHTAPGLGYDEIPLSGDTYVQIRNNNAVFEEIALVADGSATLTGHGDPERVEVGRATHTFFPLLGVEPPLGRTFTADDDHPEGPSVVLLTHGLWQRRYASDPTIVGRSIEIDGAPVEVIGVLPEGFEYTRNDAALWVPLGIDTANPPVGAFSYNGIARLLPGRTAAVAETNLEPLVERLLEANRDSQNYVAFIQNGQFGTLVNPLKEDLTGNVRQPLLILLGTVAFVLLIACANVANLMIVRSDARRREMAVRAALGAGRTILARQFLMESAVLAAAGGMLGLVLAWVGVPALLSLAPEGLPRIQNVSISGVVLTFTAGLVLLSTGLFGSLPLARAFSRDAFASLTSARGATEGPDRHRIRSLLVAGQTALALVLLIGSGLMIRSFAELNRVDPGFDPDNLLTFRLSLPPAEYATAQSAAGFHQRLLDRLAGLPGVLSVGAVDYVPMTGEGSGTAHVIEDKPTAPGELPPMLWYKYASAGYFEAMGTRVLEGRAFDRADHERELPHVVVSRNAADRIWPGESALGKRLSFAAGDSLRPWYTVVGVVESVRDTGLDQDARQIVYYPMVGTRGDDDWIRRSMTFVVRTSGPPTALAGAVRAQVWEMDSDLPIADLMPLSEIVSRSQARESFTMMSLAVAAIVALVLGAVGLYGVVSYVVSERTREIGVRIALGAESTEVLRLVVGQGVRLALAGLAVGIVAALALSRLMSALLYGTSPTDPLTFAATSALLLAVGVAASYLPARRASTIDPVESLRAD